MRVLVGDARGSPWVFLLVGALRSPVDDATGAGVHGKSEARGFLFLGLRWDRCCCSHSVREHCVGPIGTRRSTSSHLP